MALVIPTYFTAVNGISPTMVKIGAGMNKLGAQAQAAQARMNSVIPSFGGVGAGISRMLPSLASAGVIAAVALSGKAIMDYETEISNLSAVTGATGEQLDIFKQKIKEVATDKSIQRSAVEVAKAFTTVDNNMPELHKLPADLAEVTKQTIILAKASRMELQPSAEAMTMTMNQFALSAKDAAHVVDVMAAGAVYGSSRIAETAEALQKFGAAAKNTLNVTYEESVGLVELASKFEKGSEAGTRLRNILLAMATLKGKPELAQDVAQLGVNIDIVTDKAKPLYDRLKELKPILSNTILSDKMFGVRNISMVSGLLSRIEQMPAIMNGLKSQGLGLEMSQTNTDNLSGSIQKLTAAWVTLITTGNQTSAGLKILNGVLGFLTDHMEGIVTTTLLVAEAFYGWKAVLFLTTKSVYIYEFALGALATANDYLLMNIRVTTASLAGFDMATKLASIGVAGLVASAGLAVVAIGVLAAVFQHSTHEAAALNTQLDAMGDKLTINNKKTTQAQIGLERYQQALKDYNNYRQDVANAQYDKEHGVRNFGNVFGLYQPTMQAAEYMKPRVDNYVSPSNYSQSKDKEGSDVIELKKETNTTTNTITGDEAVGVLKKILDKLPSNNMGGRMPRTQQTGGYTA
jgi:TP901 family phage tail tape measure protein